MLDREATVYQCFMDTAINMTKCAGLIVNSFELLEERSYRALVNGECAPGVTMPPEGLVAATELEKRVTELLDPDKGRPVREQVKAMRDGAAAAMTEGGTSHVALAKLVESFKQG
ncbi:hypothetical protein Patl1_20247 [Pistacia atlantica]|uniref:Uncharacterized protein n=1 Tax=Pistacia atlantica TaxID=434234 RepID=A0ACC1BL80_9ROSI|nr:hypothetical protein Patl1_20247 [Pistacia atlantica]